MTKPRTLTTLAEGGHFFESPRWHEGRWWVSDFYGHAVMAYDDRGRGQRVVEVEGQPCGLGWLPDGDLLVVSMKEQRILRRARDGGVSVHADLSALVTGSLNDMIVVDGDVYVGSHGFDLMGGGMPATAPLVRVSATGEMTIAAADLWFPNGMVITSGGTLIVAETFAARLTAFAIQADGTLTDRRVWAQLATAAEPADLPTMISHSSSAPDGCAIDADDHIWVANAIGGVVSRVAPEGQIVDEVVMPGGLGAYACGLGGDDGRTLVVCAAPDFDEHARAATAEAVLLTTTVEVPAAT